VPRSVDENQGREVEELAWFGVRAVATRLPDNAFQVDIDLHVPLQGVERAARDVLASAGGPVVDSGTESSRQLVATLIESGILKTNAAAIFIGITEVGVRQTRVRIVATEEGLIKSRVGEKAAIEVAQALLHELSLGPAGT
jgi:hypothetical protein